MIKLNSLNILFLTITIGTGLFLCALLIPVVQFRIEQQDDEVFNERFFGYGSSQTVSINFTENNNESQIKRGREIFAACAPAYFDLIYERGRMFIAIDDEVKDDPCSMAIRQYESDIHTSLDCMIPEEKLATWEEWTSSPHTLHIREHCKVISSSNFEIVPAE